MLNKDTYLLTYLHQHSERSLLLFLRYVFYRIALNAERSSHEKAVCLSVKRVHCDKTEKDLSRFLCHTKDHLA